MEDPEQQIQDGHSISRSSARSVKTCGTEKIHQLANLNLRAGARYVGVIVVETLMRMYTGAEPIPHQTFSKRLA